MSALSLAACLAVSFAAFAVAIVAVMPVIVP